MDKDSIQTILEQYSIIKRHGQRHHTNYTGVFYTKKHGQRQHTIIKRLDYTGTVFYNKEAWTKTAYKLYWNSIL